MAALPLSANPARASPLVASLFPAELGVVAAELATPGLPEVLWDEERWCIARAVPARAAEFAAGRHCAHWAMAQLGADVSPLLAGVDRAPQWPEGITGSITHTASFAAAVVAHRGRCRALGLDAQAQAEVRPELWREFCTTVELQRLHAMLPDARAIAATLCFAAKEAFYKCQYMLGGTWLDFDAVEIEYDLPLPEAGEFRVCRRRPPACDIDGNAPWRGRFRQSGALLLAGIART